MDYDGCPHFGFRRKRDTVFLLTPPPQTPPFAAHICDEYVKGVYTLLTFNREHNRVSQKPLFIPLCNTYSSIGPYSCRYDHLYSFARQT